MSISIQNDEVILSQDPSLPDDGIEWTPNQDVTVSGGNYGTVQNVVIDEDTVTVTTSSGVLKFSGPALDEAEGTFDDSDYENTSQQLDNVTAFDVMSLIELMADMELQLSKTDSQIRLTTRQNAYNEAIQAAKDIMKGATTQLIMGCVSGGLSIGMSLLSAGMQAKSLGGVGEGAEDVSLAKTESNIAQNQTALENTNVEIAENQAQLDTLNQRIADQDGPATEDQLAQKEQLETKINTLKERAGKLTVQREQLTQKLQDAISRTRTQLDSANEEVDKRQEAVDNETGIRRESRLRSAIAKRDALTNRLNRQEELQTTIHELGEPPNADSITGDQVNAMRARADKVNNFEGSGRSWKDIALDNKREAWGRLNTMLTQAQATSGKWQAGDGAVQGLGKILDAGGSYAAQQGSSDAKKDDAFADQERSSADQANSNYNRVLDLMSQFLSVWSSIEDGRHQTMHDIVQA